MKTLIGHDEGVLVGSGMYMWVSHLCGSGRLCGFRAGRRGCAASLLCRHISV